ncbi:MAG: zinc ribbon domain-containing protein, partial [bacterium]
RSICIMNLVPCRECAKEVSIKARFCPSCGAPYPARRKWDGTGFEWKTKSTFYGYPLIHIAFGKNAEGKFRVAKGIIAIGQFAIGLITFAQFGIGIIFGFGQFILGLTAVSQIAITTLFGIGQFATGYVAIGQFVVAYYGLAQYGWAKFLWSVSQKDPQAAVFFKFLAERIGFSTGTFFK